MDRVSGTALKCVRRGGDTLVLDPGGSLNSQVLRSN